MVRMSEPLIDWSRAIFTYAGFICVVIAAAVPINTDLSGASASMAMVVVSVTGILGTVGIYCIKFGVQNE